MVKIANTNYNMVHKLKMEQYFKYKTSYTNSIMSIFIYFKYLNFICHWSQSTSINTGNESFSKFLKSG